MDGIENPSAELAALKAEFDELREQNADLRGEVQALKQRQPAQQPGAPTVGRRGLLAGGGVGALALLASMGGASAATDPSDSDADLGTSANPWDTYLNGLALDVADISSATTVAEPVVRYDPSVSGFTITIDSDLEGPSGYSQPVVLQEVGGSSNTVTVDTQSGNGVNGGASISLNKAYATTVLYWTGGEWRTDWLTQTVDAGTVAADDYVLSGASKGSTSRYLTAFAADDAGGEIATQATDAVSTSATSILDPGLGFEVQAALVVVEGDERAAQNRFTDLVHYFSKGSPSTVSSTTQNSAAGRTYSLSSEDLQLAMASGTYDVVATALVARRDQNATS